MNAGIKRTVIITGAASPIGKSIAKKFYSLGANLFLSDVDGDQLADLVDEVPGAKALVGDLSEESVARDMVAGAKDAFGGVDILINNAGGGVIRPFLEHDAESLQATLNRNLWTTLWSCHASLPLMIANRWGRIINIGADSVRNGLWDHAGYNAAKGGVHGLTTGLAREFATTGVTINTVAPCMVATPMVERGMATDDPFITRFNEVIPMGRPAELDEVSSMVAYLASDDASFVTGQVISVNGGSTML